MEKSFLNPPDSIRTGVYWYWMSDNISKEGVVADLKAMKKAGINLAFIGNIGPSTHHNQNYPYGKVKFMSDEWWEVIHTALKTATELNIEIGIFNSPGWSQSGGPWIKPEQSMRYLASKEIQVSGGRKISVKLLPPTNHFQDLKTIAFPTARKNLLDDSYRNITVSDSLPIVISFSKNETVRGIMLYPDKYLNAKCAFQVKDGNGYRTVKEFSLDRDVTIDIQRGYDQLSPIVESLTETTGKEFRLIFKNAKPKSIISSLVLTSSPLVNHYPENIYAKFPTTIPPFFPSAGETNYPSVSESEGAVNPEKVLDISQYLSGDGTLNWTVPAGEWTIMRLGMTTTTIKNTPASPEATGLEVDKINKKHIQAHFESFLGEIYRRIPAEDRRSWKYTVMDSWEKASQNITDGMLEKFQQRYGYDPTPYLPAYYGYVVGNHELTERFLWDLHRFIADAMAYEYVAGLREISHQYKLKTWLENYGHYGFTGEFLQYGGQSDEVA
ncbi:MAG: glycosyl hydrolase, partial [Bacteroidota bacterium]|nr:glycosyl hydrolase [Bacteroidota bacterium]MDP4225510.1 glycosyl hydrolase [Bacteroidota bacterium]